MKYLLFSLLFLVLLTPSYAIQVAMPDDDGVFFTQIMDDVPEEAVWPIPDEFLNIQGKYLNIKNKKIVEKDADERLVMDISPKYRKKVNGKWVEKTPEEKQQQDIDDNQTYQTNKVQSLKIVENKYVDFLTNEWSSVLSTESITNITANALIQLPYSNHVQYLYILKTKDNKQNKPTYNYFTTQFLFFKDLIKDESGNINIVGVHPEI